MTKLEKLLRTPWNPYKQKAQLLWDLSPFVTRAPIVKIASLEELTKYSTPLAKTWRDDATSLLGNTVRHPEVTMAMLLEKEKKIEDCDGIAALLAAILEHSRVIDTSHLAIGAAFWENAVTKKVAGHAYAEWFHNRRWYNVSNWSNGNIRGPYFSQDEAATAYSRKNKLLGYGSYCADVSSLKMLSFQVIGK